LGVPADRGRAAHTRPSRGRLDDPADPAAPPDPTGTVAAHRHQLAAVPAHAGDQRGVFGRTSGRPGKPFLPWTSAPRPGRLPDGTTSVTSWSGTMRGEPPQPLELRYLGCLRRCRPRGRQVGLLLQPSANDAGHLMGFLAELVLPGPSGSRPEYPPGQQHPRDDHGVSGNDQPERQVHCEHLRMAMTRGGCCCVRSGNLLPTTVVVSQRDRGSSFGMFSRPAPCAATSYGDGCPPTWASRRNRSMYSG
jgi:hypothetical protein